MGERGKGEGMGRGEWEKGLLERKREGMRGEKRKINGLGKEWEMAWGRNARGEWGRHVKREREEV